MGEGKKGGGKGKCKQSFHYPVAYQEGKRKNFRDKPAEENGKTKGECRM